jgi:hypothetical protein
VGPFDEFVIESLAVLPVFKADIARNGALQARAPGAIIGPTTKGGAA